MKKSLLALAVVFAASSATASAATVYDKDGTTLTVGGRVQSVFYNGFYKKAGYKDASLVNSSRFSVAVRIPNLIQLFSTKTAFHYLNFKLHSSI